MGATNKTLDSSILTSTGAKVRKGGIAGEAISAGQAVYQDSSLQRYKLAQANTATAADCKGIAQHSAAAGQPLDVIYEGNVKGLTALTVGKIYVVSDDSAGDVMEVDDLGSGDYATVVGIATAATTMKVGLLAGSTAQSGDVT